MLNLKRLSGESLTIRTSDGEVSIHFTLQYGQLKLAIDAPKTVEILRSELLDEDGG